MAQRTCICFSLLASMDHAARSFGDYRIGKAIGLVTSLMIPGETLAHFAPQRRLFALLSCRRLVVASSARLIAIERGVLGGFVPRDIRWQDVTDVRIRIGLFGADVTVQTVALPRNGKAVKNKVFVFDGLRKEQAKLVYRYCQVQESAWRERRRLRELEEARARSGGFHGGVHRDFLGDFPGDFHREHGTLSDAPAGRNGLAPGEDGLTYRLHRAKALFSEGLIADADYEAARVRLASEL
jgi:hypothetical protein